MYSALPEKSNLSLNSMVSDGLGVAQKPRLGRAAATYGACERTEEKWIMLREKLESACMDNLLLSATPPPPTVSRRHGRDFHSEIPNFNVYQTRRKELGVSPSQWGGDLKAWRCDVNSTKKQQNYKDL